MALQNFILFWIAIVLITASQSFLGYLASSGNGVTTRTVGFSSLIVAVAVILLILERYTVKKEGYFPDYQKDYCRSMTYGKVVGGAVYASDPYNTPGLGWLP